MERRVKREAAFISSDDLKNLFGELLKLPKRHLIIEIAKLSLSLEDMDPEFSVKILAYISGYSFEKTCDALKEIHLVTNRWTLGEKPENTRIITKEEDLKGFDNAD